MTTDRLYHGSPEADRIRREGFATGAALGVRWRAPWVPATDDRDLAAQYGEVLVIDAAALRVMSRRDALTFESPVSGDMDQAFCAWVRDRGYDAVEHPQDPGEVMIVRPEAIRVLDPEAA